MIYRRRFIVLLFSIANFCQLSPTMALNQECISQSVGLPPTGGVDTDELAKIFVNQCNGLSDCTVDLASWSTNGDSNFDSTCKSAGGEVYDIDVILTCPSADTDGVTKITLNNVKECLATVCTISDAKEISEAGLSSGTCDATGTVTSDVPMTLRLSSALFAAMSAGLVVLASGL